MWNKYKKKLKTLSVLAIGILIMSFYFALAIRYLFLGNPMTFNPIVLLKDIPMHGFPLKSTLCVFVVFVVSISYLFWKSKNDSFQKDSRNFKYSNSGVYGTAGLLQESELDGYAFINSPKAAKGTILGQTDKSGSHLINTDMKSRMNKHVAVFGCSGSGKSRCYARPFIIQAVKRRESVIVTDPKGELYESTAQYLKDNGYIVKILDLVHPDKSDGWACIKELRGEEIRAQILANVIIQNTGDGKGDVWDNSAMSLLKALLLRVERGHDFQEQGKQSIGDAYEMIQNPLGEKYLDSMFNATELKRDEQLCIGPYMTFKQGSDNMRGNIITGLATRLQVLQNEVIRKITAVDDIDLTLPATKPCAYYCIMSDQHTTLNFISTLFFTFLFMDLVEFADMHGGQCPVPVNFLLDEFPNIGSIPDFEKKIATVRSRAINISIIFQGITQLQERYPKVWSSILGNCDTHLFLGCNEEDTAKFISNRSGETTVKVGTVQHEKLESIFTIGRRHSSGDGKRKIFNPDEIMKFPLDEELIILRGKDVMRAYKYDFSLHPEANKFHDISIQERPSINDTVGRAMYKRKDEEYMERYNNKSCKGSNGNYDNEDENGSSFAENLKKFFRKNDDTQPRKDSMFNFKERIKEKGDIELQSSDYVEYDSEVVNRSQISFVENNDNETVAEVISVDDFNIEEPEKQTSSKAEEENSHTYTCPTDNSLPAEEDIERLCPKAPEVKPKNNFRYNY